MLRLVATFSPEFTHRATHPRITVSTEISWSQEMEDGRLKFLMFFMEQILQYNRINLNVEAITVFHDRGRYSCNNIETL